MIDESGNSMRYINKVDLLIIARNMSLLMIGIGLLCLVPIIVDLIFLEFNAISYLIPALISIFLGVIFAKAFGKYGDKRVRLKHTMMISSLSWLWACIVCASILYLVTGTGIIDCAFECMSALTGSGITIYADVEALPYSILFFRAFQQWIGGLGVVLIIISFVAKPGSASHKLYVSEAREDRIKPSTKATLKNTIIIYFIYTALGIALYILAGMPIFDAVCNTFSIISTGGMSIKNANIGFYQNDIIYFITMVLMVLGATSFLAHFYIIKTRGRSLIHDSQFQVMICLIAVTSMLIYFASNILPMDVLFTVVSAITTTGASIESSTVMGAWPSFVIFIIMMLMLIGGSTGSTVGAIKLNRVISFSRGIYRNLRQIISPRGAVIPNPKSKGKLDDKVATQSGNYITLYCLCIIFTWAAFCLYCHDPFNSLFFSMSMQGNIGLEIGQLSQTIEWPLKIIGMFNMWSGRLEIYPLLITFRAFFEIFKR